MAPISSGGGQFPFVKDMEAGDGSLHAAMDGQFGELAQFQSAFTQVAMQVTWGSTVGIMPELCARQALPCYPCKGCACHPIVAHTLALC